MYLQIVNKRGHVLLFFIFIAISGVLSAQNTNSSFFFLHWDSLYTKTLEKPPGSADSIVQELLRFTEKTEGFYGSCYSKYVLANESYRVNAWNEALKYNREALMFCQDVQKEFKRFFFMKRWLSVFIF